MAPKKAKAKPKAKEEPPAAVEQDDAEKEARKRMFMLRLAAKKWAQAQLQSVQIQARAAENEDIHWLAEFHGFHEDSLFKIIRRLDAEKTLDDVPEEAREKIAAYCAQSANGPSKVDRDTFQPMADIWAWASTDAEKYERPPASAEDVAAEKRLTEWSDASISGMADFIALMSAHAAAPSVQQIGLIRIGALCPEEGKSNPSVDVSGMKCARLVPAIDSAMRAHDLDIQVLRGGYAALRALAMVPGELPVLCDLGGMRVVAEMLDKHYKDEELAGTANTAIFAMARQSGKNSPELKAMLDVGVPAALQKVMTHHAYNHALVSKVRLTFPFLQEE